MARFKLGFSSKKMERFWKGKKGFKRITTSINEKMQLGLNFQLLFYKYVVVYKRIIREGMHNDEKFIYRK